MKTSKLKKLLLQAREVHDKKKTVLKNLSETFQNATRDFARKKEDLKTARKKHKEARKHFRTLQKSLKKNQGEQKEAQQILARLEKKWHKVSKGNNKAANPIRKPRQRKKQSKPSIKVIPAENTVTGN